MLTSATAQREVDAAGIAQLIEERLGEREGLPPAADPAPAFALLLIRLAPHDGGRLLLPTPSNLALLADLRGRLAGALRGEDRFSVLGINEIAVFLARVRSASVARLAMHHLKRALTLRGETDGEMREVHPAIGGAMPSAGTRCAEQLAAAAESACRTASGKEDRLHLQVDGGSGPDRSELVPELRAAIEGNRLEVHYQPLFSFAHRRCTTVEALVRWPRAAGRQPVAPDAVVDIARQHGLIQGLTRFVLNTALREIGGMAPSGIGLGVAVNLSPALFGDADLPETVAQALSVWGVAAERLTLEITEASDIGDSAAAMDAMARLRTLGARLSIDDFGTGYSSLARLRAMPLAELKIDRLFVANMNRSRADLQIVRTAIDLAHNFELEVVAEGAEDEPTVRHLHRLGCDAVQGFFIARPMPAQSLRAWWGSQPDCRAWMDSPPQG
jgi:EAL domain-containing protein (putative c-di-GMP-specific phosphodiesterase class I)